MPIRPLEFDDINQKFYDLIIQETNPDFLLKMTEQDKNNFWSRYTSDPNLNYYVFSDKQNGIVGFVSIVINPPILPYNMTYATIGQISVDKNFDTVTIGDALLKKCFKVAQKFKCSKVLSLCEPKNIEFYKKCGFIQSSYTMEKVL